MLEVVEVSKGFPGRPVLNAVSLSVNSGDIIGLLGGNGVGKTTLLRLIAGLEEPEGGTIRWRGETWAGESRSLPPWQRPIGMLFQQPTLWPHLNVRQHLELVLTSSALSRGARRERLARWLGALSLETLESRFPAELSGGQQCRVALARALVREPELLLLDEPFAPMDASHQLETWGVIKEFARARNTCAILVSQDRAWAKANLDRIFELESREA